MKKIINILMALSLIFTYACNGDQVGAIYNPSNDLAEFVSKKQTVKIQDPTQNVCMVTVSRDNASGKAEIPLKVETTADIFTIPQTVVFEDSVKETTIPVTINTDKMTVGVVYELKLGLPKQIIKEKLVNTVLMVSKDYSWKPYATGNYSCALFGSAQEINLLQAVEDANRFKLCGPYADGVNLEFNVKADKTIELPGGLNNMGVYDFETGFVDPDLGPISSYVFPTSTMDIEAKTLSLDLFLYCGLGGFGKFTDKFTW